MQNESGKLYLSQVPAAFVSIADKHNALVDLIKTITGANGVKVTSTDSNIIIEIAGSISDLTVGNLTVNSDATIAGSLEVSGGITGDLAGTATSFSGNLIGEVTGTMDATYVAEATSYNTALSIVRRGANGEFACGDLFADSITVVTTLEAHAITAGTVTATRFGYDNAVISVTIDGNGMVATRASNGYSFNLNPALLTHSMSVITLDVCDSGSPAQILVLGSATF